MNVYAIPVALMLVSAAFIPQGFATPHSVAPTCCTTFVNKPIPRQLLKGYIEVINSRCPRKAVIFKTKLGKEICAKPHEKWVQDSMDHLNKMNSKGHNYR
ncbi:CC-Chemokine [Baboon cytomegalovirus]|nr:CC-Chemokine [Baboon cytomegalovirus]